MTHRKLGLVALYDIQPGNGVGLFLQPLSPHRTQKLGSAEPPTFAVGRG